MRYPLVDGQGNFGSIDDDPAAAMRYTEARLTRLAMEMLRDIDMDTVDFVPNYDGRRAGAARPAVALPEPARQRLVGHRGRHGHEHPAAQPARGHRRDVVAFIDDPAISVEALMGYVKGPDFPTGGIILGRQGIRDAYETGRGRVRVRARAHIEPITQGKEAIIVTELPYTVKKGGDGGLIQKIADLVHEKKIPEITDLRDESDRHGMRLVIELKRDALPKVVLNKLYKHTRDAVDVRRQHGRARRRRAAHAVAARGHLRLRRAPARGHRPAHEARARRQQEARVHILEGLLIALDNLDAIIELIRASRDREAARQQLIDRFELTRDPGVGDPRPAPLAADRARVRRDQAGARRQDRADRRAARDPRRRVARPRPHQGGAAGDRRALRRRAAHGDHRQRGRARHRGPDRRPADGHHDHEVGLHQVAAAGHLPQAAPRRRRRDRDGHEGRRLHRAPLRVLVARLPAVLLQPRQGLPLEGLRAAGGVAHGEGPRARQRAARCARASGSSPCSPRATSPSRSTSSSRPARAS